NEPDPRDVKIASLKQHIQELERRQEKTRSKQAWETLNGENPFLYVCDRGNHRGGVRKETLCRLGLRDKITECVDFQAEENDVSYPGVVLGVEEESMPVYDTDIEDVIEEEE
ncbi:hypothetical protein Tco_1375198, partial [Tanacetum coccineum]